jgi:hypothetical protein
MVGLRFSTDMTIKCQHSIASHITKNQRERQARPAKRKKKKSTHHFLPLGLPLLPLPAQDKHLGAKHEGERTQGEAAKVAVAALDRGGGVFGGLGACAGFWVGGLGDGGWLEVEV